MGLVEEIRFENRMISGCHIIQVSGVGELLENSSAQSSSTRLFICIDIGTGSHTWSDLSARFGYKTDVAAGFDSVTAIGSGSRSAEGSGSRSIALVVLVLVHTQHQTKDKLN